MMIAEKLVQIGALGATSYPACFIDVLYIIFRCQGLYIHVQRRGSPGQVRLGQFYREEEIGRRCVIQQTNK